MTSFSSLRSPAFLVLGLGLAAPQGARAQQASQHGVVSQTVNETVITLEYDRPVARGRALFGELIEWDVVWTPGANHASWIDVSTPVRVEGHELPAGRYGIWLTPRADAAWEVVLVSDWDTHHSYFPFETEALRLEVEAVTTDDSSAHMETLAFYFPVVGPRSAELRMHWGTTWLPFRIEVP